MKPKAHEYIGDEKFQKLFGNLSPEMMPIHEIRTFLLGFILAPELVSFDWLIEEMLLVGTPSEITFKSQKHLQQFADQILALWNSIVTDLGAKRIPKLSTLPENMEDQAILVKVAIIRMSEIDCLLGSLSEGGTDYESCPDPKAAEVMEWLEKNADFLEHSLVDLGKKKPTKRLSLEVRVILEEFDNQWASKFKVLEEGLRKVRLAKLSEVLPETEPHPHVVMDKVGRNEPCPCGSGRKYKKCCGVMH